MENPTSEESLELLKLMAPKGDVAFDMNDEIVQGCLVAHEGTILLTSN